MSLFLATVLTGLITFILGLFFAKGGRLFKETVLAFLRSKLAAVVTFGAATVWFLWIIAHLGEADFGQYRHLLFLLFLAIGVLSFYYVPDFLSVRGACILVLLASRHVLDAAYMQLPDSRFFLVGFIYLAIGLALYFGALPFKLRDFLYWVYAKAWRSDLFGYALALCGALLIGLAFIY